MRLVQFNLVPEQWIPEFITGHPKSGGAIDPDLIDPTKNPMDLDHRDERMRLKHIQDFANQGYILGETPLKPPYPAGTTFNGEVIDGLMQGRGSISFPDGSVYKGLFCDGKMMGPSELTYPDGSLYEGDLVTMVINQAFWQETKYD